MHELGIVFHIADSVVQVAKDNGAARVHSVTLEVCELLVERLPAVTYCDACGKTYPTVEHGKTCPHCGSDKTWLQTGNEVNIREISVL